MNENDPINGELEKKLWVRFRAFDRVCEEYFDPNITAEQLHRLLSDICYTYIFIEKDFKHIPKAVSKKNDAPKTTLR